MNTTWKRLAFVLPTLLVIGATASAGQINMILSDVDIQFQGALNSIFDAADMDGGNLDKDEADAIASTLIEVDDVIQPHFMEPGLEMWGDLLLDGGVSLNSLSLGGGGLQPLVTTGFGFHWFTSANNYLKLSIQKVDVLLTSNVFFFTAEAVVVDQNLPDGIEFDGDISLSYTATAPAVQTGQSTTLALSSGALTITGIALVPEPGTSLLIVASALGLCMPMRRSTNR